MSFVETVLKIISGDAAYQTVQEFNSVEDAYNDRNPLTDVKATVSDIRKNNTRYKLKNVSTSQNDGDSISTVNNTNND